MFPKYGPEMNRCYSCKCRS